MKISVSGQKFCSDIRYLPDTDTDNWTIPASGGQLIHVYNISYFYHVLKLASIVSISEWVSWLVSQS